MAGCEGASRRSAARRTSAPSVFQWLARPCVDIAHARAQAARGEILLHWDDDDLYDPSRIEAQIRPLLDGTADMSALTYSHAAAHAGGSSPTWYAVKRGGAAQAMHAQSARETRAHTHSARWLEIT